MANLTTISLPTVLELSYNSGQEITYQLGYNQENQMVSLSIERRSDGDTTHVKANFNYASDGKLSEVTGTSGTDPFQMDFSYRTNNTIQSIDYSVGGEEIDLDLLYEETQNSYLIVFNASDLPLSFNFDEQNRLTVLGVQENSIIPSYSNLDKGIFHDVRLQPALHIWNGLFFFLAPWELYFFSERDIESFGTENPSNPTVPSRYQNKLRDGTGNLIAFQLRIGTFSSLIIDYTVTYEHRTL